MSAARDWLRATLLAVAKEPACALDLEDGNVSPVVDLMVEALLVGGWLVHDGEVHEVIGTSPHGGSTSGPAVVVWVAPEKVEP